MVGRGVDVVDTDRVCADGLHKVCVEAALGVVDERVVGDQLVGDALDEELVAAFGEELGAFGVDGVEGVDGGQAEEGRGEEGEAHRFFFACFLSSATLKDGV